MRITTRLSAGLVAGLAVLANVAPAAAQETGSIKGTFVLKGQAPKLEPHNPGNKDPEVCGKETLTNEMLIVDPATKGVQNVFVWVAKIDAKKIPADLQKPKEDKVTIDNKNCAFVPHCLVAHESQTLVMLNSDPVAHNVHTIPLKPPGINQSVGANDQQGIEKPVGKAQTLPTKVQCDIHPWMTGYMLVLDHPYAAITNETGEFTIEGLPPGEYDLKVWHEAGGYVGFTSKGIQKVKVAAGDATDIGKKEIDVKDMKQLPKS